MLTLQTTLSIIPFTLGTVKRYVLTLKTFGEIHIFQGDFMFNFYNVYVDLCNKKGITPSRAALEMGLSKVSVSNWKSRRNSPTDANLQKIADYFGVTVEYLKGEEKIKNTPDELQLTEGEKMLLNLFRQIPEERQQAFLEMGRLYSDSLK